MCVALTTGDTDNPSSFLRMTFETSAKFLTESAIHGDRDTMRSPAARLCMGQVIESGTGGFDLLVPAK